LLIKAGVLKNGGKLAKNVPKMGAAPILYKSAGLINQTPTSRNSMILKSVT
jgi:hypothetical protein